jgi:hypothetical protein
MGGQRKACRDVGEVVLTGLRPSPTSHAVVGSRFQGQAHAEPCGQSESIGLDSPLFSRNNRLNGPTN